MDRAMGPICLSIVKAQPVIVLHVAVDITAPRAAGIEFQLWCQPDAQIRVERVGVVHIPDQLTDLVARAIVDKLMRLTCQPSAAHAKGESFIFPGIRLVISIETGSEANLLCGYA